MPWIDYTTATEEQQGIFRAVNPQLAASDYKIYCIWITRNGRVSRRKGDWQWTKKAGGDANKNILRAVRGDDVRSKGDMREFKTADFHLNKEPT